MGKTGTVNIARMQSTQRQNTQEVSEKVDLEWRYIHRREACVYCPCPQINTLAGPLQQAGVAVPMANTNDCIVLKADAQSGSSPNHPLYFHAHHKAHLETRQCGLAKRRATSPGHRRSTFQCRVCWGRRVGEEGDLDVQAG